MIFYLNASTFRLMAHIVVAAGLSVDHTVMPVDDSAVVTSVQCFKSSIV